MNKPLILYTLYDVLFLKYLLFSYPLDGKLYQELIPQLIKLVFLERKEVFIKFKNIQINLDKLNNNFIYVNDKQIKLVDIYNTIKDRLSLSKFSLNNLLNVNYFK